MVANIINTYFVTVVVMSKPFWLCAPEHFNYQLFEDYQCETNPIYLEREYTLPFSILGFSSFTVAPAVIYTIIYAIFASVFAPFLGFFASGFKRAVGIKDFAATLPGHGGLIDRVDCISIMCFFNYFMLT